MSTAQRQMVSMSGECAVMQLSGERAVECESEMRVMSTAQWQMVSISGECAVMQLRGERAVECECE